MKEKQVNVNIRVQNLFLWIKDFKTDFKVFYAYFLVSIFGLTLVKVEYPMLTKSKAPK